MLSYIFNLRVFCCFIFYFSNSILIIFMPIAGKCFFPSWRSFSAKPRGVCCFESSLKAMIFPTMWWALGLTLSDDTPWYFVFFGLILQKKPIPHPKQWKICASLSWRQQKKDYMTLPDTTILRGYGNLINEEWEQWCKLNWTELIFFLYCLHGMICCWKGRNNKLHKYAWHVSSQKSL